MGSILSCMTARMERLPLDLTQALKGSGVREYLEFVILGSFKIKIV